MNQNPSITRVKMFLPNGDKEVKQIRTVYVMIEFLRIGEIDTMGEKFNAEIYIEARWLEDGNISEYNEKTNWNPKLSIENALQISKESVAYDVSKDANNNTYITEMRKIKGVFWERLELQNFPIDVQELTIVLSSKLNSNEIRILPDPTKISSINLEAENTFTEQQKWRLFNLVKVGKIASYEIESLNSLFEESEQNGDFSSLRTLFKHPKFVASVFCARKPGYYVFNAFFLIFLITVSSLTIFSIDQKLVQNRLQTTYTLLLTSVSFKWVINRSLPTISYLTILDKYSIFCIFYVCVLCAWHAVLAKFYSTHETIDNWVLIFFASFFFIIQIALIVWTIFAYSKIRQLSREEKEFMKYLKNNETKTENSAKNDGLMNV